MKRTILISFFLIVISNTGFSQIIREKQAVLQQAFPKNNINGAASNDTTGSVYPEFGDLFFEKNGKQYWLATFTQIVGPTKEFYRLFELKLDSGYAKEVTIEMLGAYYEVGGLNPPYYYEDIDNDGIKDILIIDHGKEADPDWRNWSAYNVFFKGTSTGFKKTEIKGLTDIKAYYHGHDIADFDNDGDLDIAVSGSLIGLKIFRNDGNGIFTQMQIGQARGNFAPFSLKFVNTDNDPELELLGPPYRDFFLNGKPQAQCYLLDLVNNKWEVGSFGQVGPFENGELWGSAQIMTFKSKTRVKPDLLFRAEGQLNSNSGWYSKYYTNDLIVFDTIMPIRSTYHDSSLFYYIDPKKADINFDGNPDLVFKEYNYGGKKHPLNERIWINDGKNRFNPSTIKFDSLLSKQMYLYVKSDTIKKYHLYMTLNDQYINNYTTKAIFNRFDSLVYPISNEFNIKVCEGETTKTQLVKVPVGMSLVKQAQKGKITIADSTASYTANVIGLDTVTFKLKNDFFESVEYKIIYTIIPKPTIPIISRDTSNSLVSNASIGNVWYKDGTATTDTTQKFKPTAPGSYAVKTTQNGCASALSTAYYYLVTDVINLSADEFIKLAPNPFSNQLNFDFVVKGYQRLNLEVFEMANGIKVASKQNQTPGMPIYLGQLSAGTYVIRVSSNDNKISYQFKMVKL
jgi:hypothetical protein